MTQLRRIFCLATFVAAATLLVMRPSLVRGQGGAPVVITPGAPVLVTSPGVVINNGPGDQTDPHVSGDLASYTDGNVNSSVRYFRFSTALDQAIPTPTGVSDSLSDVSGSRIVFTRAVGGCDRLLLFDVGTTSAWTESTLNPSSLPTYDSTPINSAPIPVGKADTFMVIDLTELVQDWLESSTISGSFQNNGIAHHGH
jgi:hypothetical protein